MAGFDNDITYSKNADFSQSDNQVASESNGLFTNGDLWIGSTATNAGGTHINVGEITSSSLTVGYSTPNITINTPGGGNPIERVALQTGTTPIIPLAGTITFNGAVTAAGTNPVRTDGTGANTMALEVQTSQAIASSNATNIGLSAFNTTEFTVDANGFVSLNPIAIPAQVTNLGIAYSAGTFTVQGYNGTALSATNPARIWLQSRATPGRLTQYTVTANQTFTDGSAGQIDNMRWGVTINVDWANDCPFYLYAVTNDAENAIAFMITRIPNLTTSPAAASIGKAGAVVNVGQGDFFSLANITVTDYDTNPCICLGSFRMQFAGGTNSWTVQTLNTAGDGIGNFNENTTFTYPEGQNGAVVTHFVQDGSAPVWDTRVYTYMVTKTGFVSVALFYGDLSGDGATATLYRPTVPLFSGTTYNQLVGWYGTGAVNPVLLANSWTSPSYNMELKSNGGATSLRQQDVAGISVNAQFGLNFSYQV
jgi:hypothetical protein